MSKSETKHTRSSYEGDLTGRRKSVKDKLFIEPTNSAIKETLSSTPKGKSPGRPRSTLKPRERLRSRSRTPSRQTPSRSAKKKAITTPHVPSSNKELSEEDKSTKKRKRTGDNDNSHKSKKRSSIKTPKVEIKQSKRVSFREAKSVEKQPNSIEEPKPQPSPWWYCGLM